MNRMVKMLYPFGFAPPSGTEPLGRVTNRNIKLYGYFSFGSGARETAPSLRGLRASRGEASGPPANAEI